MPVEGPKVAMVDHVIPEYRRQFLVRLQDLTDVDAVCYHGDTKVGYTAVATDKPLPYPSIKIWNIYWLVFGKRIMWNTCFLKIMRGRYDAVVVGEVIHNILVWAFWLFSRSWGPKLILSGHCRFPIANTSFKSRVRNYFRLMLHRRADAILAYTEEGRQDLIRCGINSKKVFVSGNTLDTQAMMAWSPKLSADRLTQLRKKYQVDDGPVLIYVGRLYSEKRIDLLIEMTDRLRKSGSNATALIIGDGQNREELETLARGKPWVHFVGEIYEPEEIAYYFTLADFMVVPDAVGLVVVHAFCYGVPTVAAAAGEHHGPEFRYIEHGLNGIVVDTLSADGFAASVLSFYENSDRLKTLKQNALEAAKGLSIEKMVDEFNNAVQHAVSQRRQSS